MTKFYMMFQVFSILTAWFARAMADGKITTAEMADLVVEVAEIFGLQTEIDLAPQEFALTAVADIEAETDAIAEGTSPVPTGGLYGG